MRQVRGSSKRISSMAEDAIEALPELPRFDGLFGAVVPRRAPRKRTIARKPKATRKTAGGRKRAAARKTSKKR